MPIDKAMTCILQYKTGGLKDDSIVGSFKNLLSKNPFMKVELLTYGVVTGYNP